MAHLQMCICTNWIKYKISEQAEVPNFQTFNNQYPFTFHSDQNITVLSEAKPRYWLQEYKNAWQTFRNEFTCINLITFSTKMRKSKFDVWTS
jgi:hypothetical protein